MKKKLWCRRKLSVSGKSATITSIVKVERYHASANLFNIRNQPRKCYYICNVNMFLYLTYNYRPEALRSAICPSSSVEITTFFKFPFTISSILSSPSFLVI